MQSVENFGAVEGSVEDNPNLSIVGICSSTIWMCEKIAICGHIKLVKELMPHAKRSSEMSLVLWLRFEKSFKNTLNFILFFLFYIRFRTALMLQWRIQYFIYNMKRKFLKRNFLIIIKDWYLINVIANKYILDTSRVQFVYLWCWNEWYYHTLLKCIEIVFLVCLNTYRPTHLSCVLSDCKIDRLLQRNIKTIDFLHWSLFHFKINRLQYLLFSLNVY